MVPHHPTKWLWWTAAVMALAAGGLVYFFHRDTGNINAREHINLTIMLAAIGIGICVISATSQWWLKR